MAALVALIAMTAPASASAQGVLPSPSGSALPGEGSSGAVAISGNLAAQSTFAESVQIFQKGAGGWSLAATLTSADGASEYGNAVAVEDCPACTPTVAVGSDSEVDVYAETSNSWTLQQQIPNPPPGWNDNGLFIRGPREVALNGDTLAIGVGDAFSTPAAVWIYTRNGGTWTEQQELPGPSSCMFGTALSLSRNQLIVGAPGGSLSSCADAAGAAYVYHRSGDRWTQQAKLTDPTAIPQGTLVAPASQFGSSVGIDGASAAVAEPGDVCGQVLTYQDVSGTGIWQPAARLPRPSLSNSCNLNGYSFASDLAMDGGRLVVGASPQQAFVFTSPAPGVWQPAEELDAPPTCTTIAGQHCSFGSSVGVSGNTELVNGGTTNAYVFP